MRILDTHEDEYRENAPDWIFGSEWCAHLKPPMFTAIWGARSVVDESKQIVVRYIYHGEKQTCALSNIQYIGEPPDLTEDDIKRLSESCQKAFNEAKMDIKEYTDILGFSVAQDVAEWIELPMLHSQDPLMIEEVDGEDCVITRMPVDLLKTIHENIVAYSEIESDINILPYS